GSALDDFTLLSHDRICLGGVRARVRHVEPLAAPGRYRVGCALEPVTARPAAPVHTLRDPALCAALVKAGLRWGLARTQLDTDERDGATTLQLVGGRIDVAAGTLTAACERTLGQHDLVRGHFEVGGRLYRFVTVVTAGAPLTLRLPAVLEE